MNSVGRRGFIAALMSGVSWAAMARPHGLRGGKGGGAAIITITGASVVPTTFTGTLTNGTSIGSITVSTTGGSFTGTLALSGTNAASFSLSSTTLPSNLLASGSVTPGTYSINIVPTQGGAINSGTAYAQSIVGATPSGVVATHTIRNTSGSEASNQVYVFGQPFRRGDIAAGQYPLLTDASDATLTWQMDEVATWDDGSLRHAAFSIFAPTIAGSGAHTIKIKKQTGTYSASAARVIGDVTAEDFNVLLEDVRDYAEVVQGSGTFVFSANNKIAGARKTATGPVRDSWVIDGDCQDNSGLADHDHLFGKLYVDVFTSPTNPSNVHGISYIPLICQPWINRAGAKGMSAKAKLRRASSVVRDYAISANFATTDVDTSSSEWLTITGIALQKGEAIKLSTTGTLPGGTSANTIYFVRPDTNPNRYRIFTDPQGAQNNITGLVNLTSQGTGTHTATRYNAMFYRQGFFIPADDAGNENWTANQPTLRPDLAVDEKLYWEQTGMVPPYDLNITTIEFASAASSGTAAAIYRPTTTCSMSAAMAASGDASTIGPQPRWVAAAWYNMTAGQLDILRANALSVAHMPWTVVLNEATERLPAFNNGPNRTGGSYATLGAPKPTTWFFSVSNTGGVTIPAYAAPGGWVAGNWTFSTDFAGSHWPSSSYLQYLLFGKRHILDMVYFAANHQCFSYTRANFESYGMLVIGATTYYSKLFFLSQTRMDAWSFREVLLASVCGADANPERVYFEDVVDENYDLFEAFVGTLKHPNFSVLGHQTNGGWFGNGFQGAFWTQMMAWGKILTRHSKAHLPLEHAIVWFKGLWDGSFLSPFYAPHGFSVICNDMRISGLAASTNYVTSWNDVYCFESTSSTYSFATDGTVTISTAAAYLLADGDEFKCQGTNAGTGVAYTGPVELDPANKYYFRDVNLGAGTAKLAATPGGAPITYSVAKSGQFGGIRPKSTFASGTLGNRHASQDSYHAQHRSLLAWAMVAGISNLETAYDECDTRYTAGFSTSARWAQVPTVTVP